MDLTKLQQILSIVGGIVLGLPVLLHSIRAFLKLIPGDPGDAAVGKIEELSQKLADLLSKFLPQPSAPSQPTEQPKQQ